MCSVMNSFENLQELWHQDDVGKQPLSSESILKKAAQNHRAIQRNHWGTLGIISLTIVVLLAYFIWLRSYSLSVFTCGLGLMIVSMLVRIGLEGWSLRKFQKLQKDLSLMEFSQQAIGFYHWRKRIHFQFTPLLYGGYIVGFTLLVPTFYTQFSSLFFGYLLLSGYGFLGVFTFFLRKKIKAEMELLAYLKKID